jgi:hypothetical protein
VREASLPLIVSRIERLFSPTATFVAVRSFALVFISSSSSISYFKFLFFKTSTSGPIVHAIAGFFYDYPFKSVYLTPLFVALGIVLTLVL